MKVGTIINQETCQLPRSQPRRRSCRQRWEAPRSVFAPRDLRNSVSQATPGCWQNSCVWTALPGIVQQHSSSGSLDPHISACCAGNCVFESPVLDFMGQACINPRLPKPACHVLSRRGLSPAGRRLIQHPEDYRHYVIVLRFLTIDRQPAGKRRLWHAALQQVLATHPKAEPRAIKILPWEVNVASILLEICLILVDPVTREILGVFPA